MGKMSKTVSTKLEPWVEEGITKLAQASGVSLSGYIASLLKEHALASGDPTVPKEPEDKQSITTVKALKTVLLAPYNVRAIELEVPGYGKWLVASDVYEERLHLRRELLKDLGLLFNTVSKEEWYKHAFLGERPEEKVQLEVDPVLGAFFQHALNPDSGVIVRATQSKFEIAASLSEFWQDKYKVANAAPSQALLRAAIFPFLRITERQGQTFMPFSKYVKYWKAAKAAVV